MSSPPTTPWQVGQIVAARLVTGIAIAPGLDPTPVLAVSEVASWCNRDACPRVTWLGRATFASGQRIQVQFTTAFAEGKVHSVRAQALGTDLIAGLPATISTQTPALAAQVVGATVAAARDYLKLLSQQQNITISNGWFTITQGGSQDFWPHLLGRLADLMAAPSAGPATVPVAEVGPGTELRLLVLAADGE